jgi:hypothetical protein
MCWNERIIFPYGAILHTVFYKTNRTQPKNVCLFTCL